MYNQSNQAVNASATTLNCAFTGIVQAGGLIIVAIRIGTSGNTITVTDTIGTTYTQQSTQAQTTDGHQAYVYAGIANGTATPTITVAQSGGATTMRYAIHEYRNPFKGSLLEATTSSQNATVPVSSGNITTSFADCLLFGLHTDNNSGTSTYSGATSPSVWNSRQSIFATDIVLYTSDLIVSSSGTYANLPVLASGTSANGTSIIVAFRLSSVRPGNIGSSIKVGDGMSRSEVAN